MEKFYICYVEGTDGGGHCQHPSLEVAQYEAERLARLSSNQGKAVYLFECVGKCKVEPLSVKWDVPVPLSLRPLWNEWQVPKVKKGEEGMMGLKLFNDYRLKEEQK